MIQCTCPNDEAQCDLEIEDGHLFCEPCLKNCKPVANGAKHLDDGKPELQYLLSMPGLLEVAKVGTYGSRKYSQWNYRAGMPWMKLLGSCARHLFQFINGEDTDPESGLAHLAHLCYNALMLLEYTTRHPQLDDRYKEVK